MPLPFCEYIGEYSLNPKSCMVEGKVLFIWQTVPGIGNKTRYILEYTTVTWQWYQFDTLFFFSFIFISWRLITLQYCSGFCLTLNWHVIVLLIFVYLINSEREHVFVY